jgi:hypothetical protein
MTKEIFDKIMDLQSYVNAIDAKSSIKIARDDVQKVEQLYKILFPGKRLNTACPSCVEMAITSIWSYYQREISGYLETTKIEEKPRKRAKKITE